MFKRLNAALADWEIRNLLYQGILPFLLMLGLLDLFVRGDQSVFMYIRNQAWGLAIMITSGFAKAAFF